MCCLVTDGGGALILTSADRAKDFPHQAGLHPRHRRKRGNADGQPDGDFNSSRAFKVAGPTAFDEAGISAQADVDHLMIYDAFAHLPLYGLGDLGFCKPGEAGKFIADGNTAPAASCR
jgi:acetyl-CoA acetyltransferase